MSIRKAVNIGLPIFNSSVRADSKSKTIVHRSKDRRLLGDPSVSIGQSRLISAAI